MQLNHIVFESMQSVLENGEFDTDGVRTYSGRGMYGDKCLAISLPDAADIARLITFTALDIARGHDVNLAEEAAQLLLQFKTDQLGRGIIMYWPDIKPFNE